MNSYLKQSTASQSRAIGPFVDDTDFKTAETALTIANTDIKLIVNGAASANKNSGGGTHRANGVYGVTFDATDTATVGEMLVSVVVSGAAPVFHTFTVLEEAVYDMLFGASATGFIANHAVNVAQWGGTNIATPDTAGYPKTTIKSGTGPGEISLSSGAVLTRAGIRKNQALANFPFLMTDSTNHNPMTGLTVTATRSIDGAAFGAGAIANMTEVSNGIYQCDLGAGDLNGETICLRFTASGADDLCVTLVTEP